MATGAARPAASVVIEASSLAKRWGPTTVFDGASFTIEAGITGLLGANGAGKTTLIGMLLGFHRPDSGRLRVHGLDPSHAGAEVRARVGYSPEHHELPKDMRAHDLVRHVAELHGLPPKDATARASDVLWELGLGEERFRPVGTMSTGQRQRVKLAQAIAHDPDLVFLDEPTDGLDPVQRDEMLATIRRVGTEFGIDVVLSSHLLEEVERVCDSAVILAAGRVAASGTLSELTSGGTGLLLEVDGRGPEVERWLSARGVLVESDDTGRRMVLRGKPDHPRPEGTFGAAEHIAGDAEHGSEPLGDLEDLARDAVVACSTGIRRMSRRTVRLEDVFLEVDR